ncbi:hypothetical protein ABFX02_08G062700 [Erythranthe guttata]
MSPPLLGIEGQNQANVSQMASSSSTDCVSQNVSCLKERNYLGLSDCSSVDSSTVMLTVPADTKSNLNLKATELRLGLPGSHSPGRESEFSPLIDEKQLFPLIPSKDGIFSSGNKRGFADTVNAFSNRPAGTHTKTEVASQECNNNKINGSNISSAPSAKAQVVGWPPIRSFRKNTLATTSKKNDDVIFVKVSMDGAPYLRKVDLRTCATYQELSSALEKMFSCFTIGQCGPEGAPSREVLSESKLRDILHGSEYVLTYEDKDGDWMLVGDVPWEMFISSCKRLKIMKGSDAIGLAPRALEKSKNRN